jgi:apolipoprotein N-acyltransferase
LNKFVPVGDSDFSPGGGTVLLRVPMALGAVAMAPLVCYEDIFPQLARHATLQGADVLVVQTNNGWFGEGGAAYQHAAHSVLRAVENRRPVIRCGNGGWSGWIDEFGSIRNVLTQPQGEDGKTVYFRGAGTISVTRDRRWIGQQTFYTRHGDWFLVLCFGLIGLGWASLQIGKITPVKPDPDENEPV